MIEARGHHCRDLSLNIPNIKCFFFCYFPFFFWGQQASLSFMLLCLSSNLLLQRLGHAAGYCRFLFFFSQIRKAPTFFFCFYLVSVSLSVSCNLHAFSFQIFPPFFPLLTAFSTSI